MNRLIVFLLFLILTLNIVAQSNIVGRTIGKKVAKESTEQVAKKVVKETAEEASEKIIKNVADDVASPVYKRAVRKGIVNSTSKSSIVGKKNNAYNYHKSKYNKRGKPKKQLTFDELMAINQIGDQNITFIAKSLNISSERFRKVIKDEFTDMKSTRNVDIKKSVHYMKTRIEELRANPELATKIFNDQDIVINEYTLAHLFPRHGHEFSHLTFQEVMNNIKSVYKHGNMIKEADKIIYKQGNKTLVFRDAKPKPYVISFYTKS